MEMEINDVNWEVSKFLKNDFTKKDKMEKRESD